MNTTSISNQVFNVGDYVRTSKGKTGIIEKCSCIEVGFHQNSGQKWVLLEKFSSEQTSQAKLAVEKWQWSYPNNVVQPVLVPNQVKLGSKTYPIWSDKLIKLDRLRIRTQQGFYQHEIELPTEDAKMLMDIYSRNNIWFTVV